MEMMRQKSRHKIDISAKKKKNNQMKEIPIKRCTGRRPENIRRKY